MVGRKLHAQQNGTRKRTKMDQPAAIIKRAVRAAHEPKRIQTFIGGLNVLAVGNILGPFNSITQGAAGDQRTGRFVNAEKFELRIDSAASAVNQTEVFRVMVVLDKESNGSTPSVGNIFADVTGGHTYLSPYNYQNVPTRFSILSDSTLEIKPDTTGVNGFCTARKVMKLGRRQKFYDTNAGTIADILSGAIWVVCASIAGTGGAPTLAASFYGDFTFRDI